MRRNILVFTVSVMAVVIAAQAYRHFDHPRRILDGFVRPGPLSSAHAFLSDNCASCHDPGKSAAPEKCILCHANNRHLLGRQSTAFHANIGACAECHAEHRENLLRPVNMDHDALLRIGRSRDAQSAGAISKSQLDCYSCHATKDRHQGLFGKECSTCHVNTTWTVAGFRHPSSRSLDCAQCHQAPPSHYMEHFRMVSMRVARVEHAEVRECFRCHQIDAWNDIVGVGYYKHH